MNVDLRRRLLLGAAPLLAVALSLAVGAIFILAIGEDPLAIYALMLRQSLGTGYGLGQTLFKATPLIFTGLAVALGFRAGLFNIGVEGQLYLGGLAAALTGVALAGLPAPVLLPLALLAAAAGGRGLGRHPRRAQGALRRARGHQHHHAQLHRLRAGLVRRALRVRAGDRAHRDASARARRSPGSTCSCPRCAARP